MRHIATNPYLPGWEYVPDGEPHAFDGRVYVYGSHDAPEGTAYCPGDYVCWSAPEDDLGAWTFEGVIWRKEDDPLNVAHVGYGAPDVCRGSDGRFYLYYFRLGGEQGSIMSVAVCNEPAGRYRYLGTIDLPNGETLTRDSGYGMPFDPAVLPIEDGGAWLYYGFGAKSLGRLGEAATKGGFVARLGADMHTMASTPTHLAPAHLQAEGTPFEGHAFFEASSIRVVDGRYYFVYSSENGHELCWGTMPGPEGPLSYGGVLVSNGDVGLPGHESEAQAVMDLGNTHGGLVRAGGRDYVFYHRHTHGAQHARQGCAESVSFGEGGSLSQVEITSCGLNGGPLPARRTYPASICCHLVGPGGPVHYAGNLQISEDHPFITQEIDAGCVTSARTFVANLRQGATVGYKYFGFDGREGSVRLEVRGTFAGEVVLRLDAPDGAEAARLALTADGGDASAWHEVEAPFACLEGTHAVYLDFIGTGALDLAELSFA